MTDFQLVTSGGHVPSATGAVVSIAGLPGADHATPAPMLVNWAILGNWGTGNPTPKAQVQRVAGGPWYDIKEPGGSSSNLAQIQYGGGTYKNTYMCFGVATRILVPTLTSPGTGATAPRVSMQVTNMLKPSHGNQMGVLTGVSEHKFSDDLGTTGDVLSVRGWATGNPNISPGPFAGTPFANLIFVTMDGDGTVFVESQYQDGDDTFEVRETGSYNTAQQLVVENIADETHIDFTDGAGTTDLWLDAFQKII